MKRTKEGQEDRAKRCFDDYFDRFENAGTSIPWLKIARDALIAWVRENHPELFPDRPVKEIMYAIGQEDGDGGIGTWAGPVPSEKEMLETPGRDNDSVIIRFDPEGSSKIIYEWQGYEAWWVRAQEGKWFNLL